MTPRRYWNPRRFKLLHRLALHRVDTWLQVGPWRTPGIEWECVNCSARAFHDKEATDGPR